MDDPEKLLYFWGFPRPSGQVYRWGPFERLCRRISNHRFTPARVTPVRQHNQAISTPNDAATRFSPGGSSAPRPGPATHTHHQGRRGRRENGISGPALRLRSRSRRAPPLPAWQRLRALRLPTVVNPMPDIPTRTSAATLSPPTVARPAGSRGLGLLWGHFDMDISEPYGACDPIGQQVQLDRGGVRGYPRADSKLGPRPIPVRQGTAHSSAYI